MLCKPIGGGDWIEEYFVGRGLQLEGTPGYPAEKWVECRNIRRPPKNAPGYAAPIRRLLPASLIMLCDVD